MAGMDPMAYLRSRYGDFEQVLMLSVARRVLEVQKIRDESNTNDLVNKIGKMLGG